MNRIFFACLPVALLLFGALPTAIFAAGAEKPKNSNAAAINSILASVNGEPISLEDVLPITRAQEFQVCAAYSGKQLSKAIYDLRKQAVESIIDRKLIVADYKARDFIIPNRDIESEIDALAERMGYRSRSEFIKKLREGGSSIDDIHREVEERIICQLMLYRAGQSENFITPADVYNYFKTHPEEFATPESIDLAMLAINTKAEDAQKRINEVKKMLAASPENFDAAVTRCSTGPGREQHGRLGTIEIKRLRPEFAAAFDGKIEAGKICGPIVTPEGTVWLKVLAHHQPREVDFGKLAPEIRRELERRQHEASAKRYTDKLREGAIVRYFFDENQ